MATAIPSYSEIYVDKVDHPKKVVIPKIVGQIKQKEALEAQITSNRQSELADAIGNVEALVADNGLTEGDVFGGSKGQNIKWWWQSCSQVS